MPWANLYAIKLDPKTKEQTIEPVNGYRKKKQEFTSHPKPIKLKDGRYILYVWASTSDFAKMDADKIFKSYFKGEGK